MSLYDKASLIFSGSAGAGNKDVAYNIKPVEKLKVDELIVNGNFDDDSGWSLSTNDGLSPTISGGKARFSGSNYKSIHQNILEAGKTYKISVEADITTGTFVAGTNLDEARIFRSSDTSNSGGGKFSTYYTALEGETKFTIKRGNLGDYDFTIDNVSVREVEQKANDFSFVRASDLTATYEGPDGLIKKTRENLLLQSNQFDTTWTLISASLTGGKSGYDGSSNAWELKATGDGSTHLARVNQTSLSVSGVSTFSVYAKAGNVNWVRLNALKGGTNVNNYFDLSGNGAVGASPSNTVVESKIESIGSNWFRISLTSKGDYPITEVRIQVAEADGDEIPATNSYVFIQNAQLEPGLVATPYIDRTDSYSKSTAGIQEDEPRYDYSLDNDAPPVLMLEPERQNYIKHSENLLPSSDWIEGRVDVTANQATSPEGLDNACKVTATVQATANTKRLYSNYWGVSDGETWTVSVFLKADTANKIELRLTSNTEAEIGFGQARFIASGSGTAEWDPNNQGDSVSITQLDNGWYRCTATGTIDSSYAGWTDYARVFVYVMDPGTGARAYVSDGTEALFLYGVQAEKGPYATSYIPTYGSAATRKGEAHNSLASFSCALDNPLSNKYTFILDLRVDNLERPTTSYDDIFTARDASGSEYAFRLEGNVDTSDDPDTYSLRVFAYSTKNSGAALSTPHDSGIQLGQRNKIAIVFDETVGIKVFLNGNSTPLEEVLIGDTFSTDSTKTLQSNSFYEVKTLDGGANPRSKTFLYGVQAYDEALSDAECVSLTTIS